MKNYQSSDYAANKYAEGIVYRFANQTVEVTLEDYIRENPGKTEADFAKLKALSDGMYLDQVRGDNAHGKKTVSVYHLQNAELVPSPEDTVIEQPERAAKEKRRRKTAKQALDTLTEVQRRRYLLHVADGLITREIAAREGVSHVAVVYSLEWAEKKIKKFLADG